MRTVARFVLGLILGGIVGAAFALLFTPLAGEELRQRMQAEAERIRAEIQKAAIDKRAELEQQLAALRNPQKTG